MGLILFLLGWYLLLRRYPYAWFLGLVGFSSVYLLAVVGVLIPWLLGPTPYPSLLRLSPWLSPTGEFLAHRGVYLLFLLFPWGLFFRWSDCRWLLLLPGLAINLNGLPHWSSLHWHYTLPLVPVLAWAALPGLRRVRNPERCCAGIALWSLGIFVARRVVWPFF